MTIVAVQCSADTFVVKIATFAKPETERRGDPYVSKSVGARVSVPRRSYRQSGQFGYFPVPGFHTLSVVQTNRGTFEQNSIGFGGDSDTDHFCNGIFQFFRIDGRQGNRL
jgi:hypothetical protein